MNIGFSEGARGPVVADLQARLGVVADGYLGPKTLAAVKALHEKNGLTEGDSAGPSTFDALGLEWPGEFERCLNLTAALEGTGFGGCNATDIDGAGLTFGCIGFTTASGEVQSLIRAFLESAPEALCSVSPEARSIFGLLINGSGDPKRWARITMPDGRVQKDVAAALKAWGSVPEMQRLQVQMAEKEFWQLAVQKAMAMGFKSMRAFGLMFDVYVQNGGWRDEHSRIFLRHDDPNMPEGTRLEILSYAVAQCAGLRWRTDVLARKLLFARGEGRVHGEDYSLRAQAFPAN